MKKENVYLIKLKSKDEEFFKIGTSVHRYCRFYEIMKFGYSVKIIYMVFGIDVNEAWDAEKELQSLFKPYTPLKKFGGYRECFDYIDVIIYRHKLKNLITSYKEITENLEISWR